MARTLSQVIPLLEKLHGAEIIQRILTHLVHEPKGMPTFILAKLLSLHTLSSKSTAKFASVHHDLAPFLLMGGAGASRLLKIGSSALIRAVERRYFEDVVLRCVPFQYYDLESFSSCSRWETLEYSALIRLYAGIVKTLVLKIEILFRLP